MKTVYSGQRKAPGGKGTVSSLTLAYISDEDGDCVLQTYLPNDEYDNIYFSDIAGPPSRSSCPWAETKQVTRRIRDPGVWTPLRNGCIVGLRKKQETISGSPIRRRLPSFGQSSLRRRGFAESPNTSPKAKEFWEIWVISRLEKEGNIDTRPLIAPEDPAGLMISDLGPIARVGYGSVAVGFGNIVKVITVGHEWFDRTEQEGLKAEDFMTSRRRRHPASRTRAASTTIRLFGTA